jgi:5'-nucleotidase
VAAFAMAVASLVVLAGPASAGNDNPQPPGNPDPKGQLIDLQLLAVNDYHGNLEASTPGAVDGEPAGGAEYLATKLSELRQGNKYSLTVAAGDLIGGSPAFSGLFHDEPSVESLNAMQLDVSGVGNHEFDEGVTELLRMQDGGCHPVAGCYFPDEPYSGADFQWLAANVVNDAGETPLAPYWIERIKNVKVGFIGMTLEATDTLVAAARRAVSVPSWLPELIDRHLTDYPPDPEGLIFTAPEGGPIRGTVLGSEPRRLRVPVAI